MQKKHAAPIKLNYMKDLTEEIIENNHYSKVEETPLYDKSAQKVLSEIHKPTTNISIYDRDISHLDNEINKLISKKINFQTAGETELIIKNIKEELEEFSLMINDLTELLHHFQKITKAASFRLLLKTVNTNMCRKFHTDINDLRMLCTYRGPGTLWLENANLETLNSPNTTEAIYNENKIEQAKKGAVLILKGALYPSNNTNAIVHRSPTIEETGTNRLLLRIDTNEFLNFDI